MRVACVLLLFVTVFSLCSCNPDVSEGFDSKSLAVADYTPSSVVAEDYLSQGVHILNYNSVSDCVIAVENGKADFTILDSFEYAMYTASQRKIEFFKKCEYTSDFCAYFSGDSEALCGEFNDALSDLKKDGTIEKIINCYETGNEYSIPFSSGENGVVTMLCDPAFEKRVYCDENGEFYGADIDIARTVFSQLGYTLEIKVADFDELFFMLEKGEGDFIISATELTGERAEEYLASDSYLTLEYYLVRRK